MMKSPVLLAVVLLLSTLGAVGYQVFELNQLRLENVNAVAQPLPSQQEGELNSDKKLPSLTALASLNLMGNAYKPVEKPVVENLVPISALKLILIGTIVKKNKEESSALIQRSNRETKRYFIGDVIEGGVSLVSVAVDQVILKREDASEVLRYPQGTYSAAFSVSAESPPPLPGVASFPQSAVIAQQALQNNSAATPSPPKVPQIGGSKRLLKLRDRLRLPMPAAPANTPANDNPQTAPPSDDQQDTN